MVLLADELFFFIPLLIVLLNVLVWVSAIFIEDADTLLAPAPLI